jgi:hypothetical protein
MLNQITTLISEFFLYGLKRVEEIYLRNKRDITSLWRGKLMIRNQKLRKVFLPLSQVISMKQSTKKFISLNTQPKRKFAHKFSILSVVKAKLK